MKKSITIFSLLLFFFLNNNVNAQEAYLGDIKLTAISFDQRGWVSCEGQLLPISQNTALFSLLGTTYGGDGRTTFGLPDLRGRVPMGTGTGAGLSYRKQGQRGGSERNVLDVSQMPTHSHAVNAVVEDGNQSVPTNHLLAGTKAFDMEYSSTAPNTTMNPLMISSSGGNQSVNNLQPYLVLRYVICIQGLFPSRS
ncbi:phage tail protein [Flavivirga jejuensis]|uniref:Tail fiber protein n=1 Tax=Flavivirga jejuensis TaxID=870487 RepID=A0ABT8WNC9_9FLAO|nr:tail fiber protein [Flavivirga jejuensis]MDO5974672.1 tail fiber protein [Flavivirga jejuensis]